MPQRRGVAGRASQRDPLAGKLQRSLLRAADGREQRERVEQARAQRGWRLAGVALAQLVHQLGRALDVGDDERDQTAWKLTHLASRQGRARPRGGRESFRSVAR